MLDEIINYVQSLQQQVEVIPCFEIVSVNAAITRLLIHHIKFKELNFGFFFFLSSTCFQFLSMKLATVNPQLDFNMENVLQKQVILLFINHNQNFASRTNFGLILFVGLKNQIRQLRASLQLSQLDYPHLNPNILHTFPPQQSQQSSPQQSANNLHGFLLEENNSSHVNPSGSNLRSTLKNPISEGFPDSSPQVQNSTFFQNSSKLLKNIISIFEYFRLGIYGRMIYKVLFRWVSSRIWIKNRTKSHIHRRNKKSYKNCNLREWFVNIKIILLSEKHQQKQKHSTNIC